MTLPSIFNPSNDMALAANVRQYLPPRRIQQMEADLVDLARVWEGTRFVGPWGWSLATKQQYRQMGVAEECLPSDEWLAGLRQLSSRQFACQYIKDLLSELKDPRLLGEEMQWIDKHSHLGETSCARIFKSPWSSSGRGVFIDQMSNGQCQMSTLKRLQGFLSSQGGFVMDKFYEDKVLDFAMEFFVNEDRSVDFLGYSVFYAAENGAYGYNYVEGQEELRRRITDPLCLAGISPFMGRAVREGNLMGNKPEGLPIQGEMPNGQRGYTLFEQLIDYHKAHLSSLTFQLGTKDAQRVGWYHGPVGIDMLKTSDGHIHPCLEMNFRMNMGILALLLHERYGAGCTIQLTPHRPNGFEALVERGKLMIAYRKQ